MQKNIYFISSVIEWECRITDSLFVPAILDGTSLVQESLTDICG